MTYTPRPIDTGHAALPTDLAPLVERLAENAHDLWAARRLAEGWTHGPWRDDARRTTPNLVSYAELPETEKEYDRDAVRETLRAVVALGYRLEAAT